MACFRQNHISGEYPLSASIASESCHPRDQITSLAMVFSMQGVGTILCSLVLVVRHDIFLFSFCSIFVSNLNRVCEWCVSG